MEAEGHIPRLPGKNHQHCGQFEAEVASWEDRNESEHQTGHEAQNGNTLQNVQQRQ